jgi:hypothetical protein
LSFYALKGPLSNTRTFIRNTGCISIPQKWDEYNVAKSHFREMTPLALKAIELMRTEIKRER